MHSLRTILSNFHRLRQITFNQWVRFSLGTFRIFLVLSLFYVATEPSLEYRHFELAVQYAAKLKTEGWSTQWWLRLCIWSLIGKMYYKQPNTIKSFELRITHCKFLYKSNPKPTFNLELRMVIGWFQQLFLLIVLRMIIL